MSSIYINGIGFVAIDANKTEAEKQATIEYYKEIAPKYKEIAKGFAGLAEGFSDTQSMIYRWGEKLVQTDDEEKNVWYQEQIKEWGQMVGIYDSIALAKYYEDLSKHRKLTTGEEADNEANTTVMNQFKSDMFYAYDNRQGDISEVQKKYGYEVEELTVLQGLGAFADMFKDNTAYAFGALGGMIAKDPELLLLAYLRIPALAAQGSARAVQLAAQAVRMQPKYVQTLGKFMQNSRIQAGIGRGVEGATYGGVYEALHDLTFKGHIEPENVKRGLALGSLIGTAFGGISGKVGNKNWFVSKTGSEAAAKRLEPPKGKPKEGEKFDVDFGQNKTYRPSELVPEQAALPEGLSHKARADMWRTRSIEIRENAWMKKNPNESLTKSRVKSEHIEAIKKETDRLSKIKNEAGSKLFSKTELKGLAEKNIAKRLEYEHNINAKKEGIRQTQDKNWGRNRENKQGEKAIEKGEFVRDKETFSHLYDDSPAPPRVATFGQMAKFGAVGAVAGYALADEDKQYGSIMGMAAAVLGRRLIKGIDKNQAKMRMRFYNSADVAKSLTRFNELTTGKTMVVLKKILMGKNPKMTHEKFLDHIELYGTKKMREARALLSKEEIDGINAVRELMRAFKEQARKFGILEMDQFITDYITHIFKGKPPKGATLKRFKERLSTDVGSANIRKIHLTINQIAKKYPEFNVETDVFKILDGYSRAMSKAIAGAHIVKDLNKVGILDGGKTLGVLVRKGENVKLAKKMGYKKVDQPALDGVLVHPLMAKAIEDFFYTPVGSTLMIDKIIVVNNALKRIAVSLSFFHAQSLILSAIYAGVGSFFSKAGKARRAKVKELMDAQWENNVLKVDKHGEIIGTTRNMTPEQFGEFTQAQLIRELAKYGIEVGVKANEFVDAGYSTMKRLYDRLPPLGKTQDWIDKWTWDVFHDHLKIFTYLTVKERAMSSTPRGLGRVLPKGWKENHVPLSEHEASLMSAKYVNDAFGGQRHTKLALEWQEKAIKNANNPKGAIYNWIALATTPSKARFSNLFAFSPDWTISNLRIAFRGMGMSKDLVTKIARGGKLTTKEMMEWNMYAGYMARGLIATSFFAYMAHKFMNDDTEEFDLEDFWLTGRLNLGGGEEMVVSKQIAEPMHWLTHPLQTALNKGAILPKAILALFLGKEYITLKHKGYIGPTLDRSSPKEMGLWMMGRVTPISVNPWRRLLKDEDYKLSDANKAAILGMIGSPIYKRTGD